MSSLERLPVFAAISVLISCAVCEAQGVAPTFQYRFGGESIPRAAADEPRAERFSSQLAREHLQTGVTLWAKRQECVSCHTHGIYMIVRPALSSSWGTPDEATRDFVVDQVSKLRQGEARKSSVPVQMAYIARGLAAWDSQLRKRTSSETDAALRFAFQFQADDGSIRVKDRWPPLNSSTYHATAMLAMAVVDAPGWLDALDDRQLLEKIRKLNSFLRDTPPINDHQRLLLLWVSAHATDLLPRDRQAKLIESIWKQQQPDGGWTIWSFATPETARLRNKALAIIDEPDYKAPTSDGYQTGLAVVVLREAGVRADDLRIQKAVKWLLSQQRESGRWWTRSLSTKTRFNYISYSGTAYAALALAKCGALPEVSD